PTSLSYHLARFDLPLPYFLFFFNDTSTTHIYTLSLHDALPIFYIYLRDEYHGCRAILQREIAALQANPPCKIPEIHLRRGAGARSEEHTSELQSRRDLVCRLLLEKKKKVDE